MEVEVALELRLEIIEPRQLDLSNRRFCRKNTVPNGALELRGAPKLGLVESHLGDAARMLRLDSN